MNFQVFITDVFIEYRWLQSLGSMFTVSPVKCCFSPVKKHVPSNRTLYLNCSSAAKESEQAVKCVSVRCSAGPFLNSLTSAKVLLEMEMDITSLEKIMGQRDIILLETTGYVRVIEPVNLIQTNHKRGNIGRASTRFIGDIPMQHVESWVIALAIAGGILLVLFVSMALHKAGFFERKKKQELKSLKRKTLAEASNYGPVPDDVSGGHED